MRNDNKWIFMGILVILLLAFAILRVLFVQLFPPINGFKLPDWVFFFMKEFL